MSVVRSVRFPCNNNCHEHGVDENSNKYATHEVTVKTVGGGAAELYKQAKEHVSGILSSTDNLRTLARSCAHTIDVRILAQLRLMI